LVPPPLEALDDEWRSGPVDPNAILARLGTDDAPTDDELAAAYEALGEL
jgi:hypothetical protein